MKKKVFLSCTEQILSDLNLWHFKVPNKYSLIWIMYSFLSQAIGERTNKFRCKKTHNFLICKKVCILKLNKTTSPWTSNNNEISWLWSWCRACLSWSWSWCWACWRSFSWLGDHLIMTQPYKFKKVRANQWKTNIFLNNVTF